MLPGQYLIVCGAPVLHPCAGSFLLFNMYGVAITGEDINHERRTLKMALNKVCVIF